MNLSFQEKSAWGSLISSSLIFGLYFMNAFRVLGNPDLPDQALIKSFIFAVGAVVVTQIILHTALAMIHRKEAERGPDERDRSIELLTTRNSYYILIFGIWASVTSMLYYDNIALLINLIMFFYIGAELVAYITKIILYRRGH